MTRSARRWFRGVAVALLALAMPAWAVDESDLLPVDEAFALSAQAPSRDRIEITWKIADTYYLYRHRFDVQVVDGGINAAPLQLPAGKKHTDEFFGEVETYRDRVTGVLAGATADGADMATLRVKYQGCADIGICYPPQVRTLRVALPAATVGATGVATPGAAGVPPVATPRPRLAAATPTSNAGFAALGRTLSGAPAPGGNTDALPLPPEQAFAFEAIANDGNTLLLRFTPAKGYYLYRDRNTFRIEGAEGIAAGTPRWPQGTSHRDEHFGEVTVYFDQVDVPLPLRRRVAGAAEATLVATFQGCQADGICYPPMTRRVRVSLPAGKVETVAEAAAALVAEQAKPGSESTFASSNAASAQDAGAGMGSESFSTSDAGSPAESRGENDSDPIPDASADNAARTAPPTMPKGGLAGALLLALLGGLVLNLMPCVLPILSLKALGLAQSGESRERARSHALWYTAGVLAAFAAIGLLVVALRAGGQALGWGFQLQQPWFVVALVYLMFAVGLSLSGVFTLGGGLGNVGNALASKTGPVGDFATGVLACVVASPCIAPFMGGALAFAFTSSTVVALAVFLMLGLGLALPFLLIGFVPALADRLPKPGAWMETLKQVLAFPMYLTAIWLAWVLGKQRGVDAMALVAAGLALFALALWWRERQRWKGSLAGRVLALALLLLSLWPIWGVAKMAAPERSATAGEGRIAYSEERLQALRDEGRVVFVNMTADWCVTCKANERRVLSRPAFLDAMQAADAAYVVGDWTDVDEAIGAYLERHGAVGVPLYVVYPADGGEGEVLPAILTDDAVVAALQRAAQ